MATSNTLHERIRSVTETRVKFKMLLDGLGIERKHGEIMFNECQTYEYRKSRKTRPVKRPSKRW